MKEMLWYSSKTYRNSLRKINASQEVPVPGKHSRAFPRKNDSQHVKPGDNNTGRNNDSNKKGLTQKGKAKAIEQDEDAEDFSLDDFSDDDDDDDDDKDNKGLGDGDEDNWAVNFFENQMDIDEELSTATQAGPSESAKLPKRSQAPVRILPSISLMYLTRLNLGTGV